MKKCKRLLSVLLVCCLVAGILPGTALAAESYIQFAGGDGTAGNPYQIATTEQLKNVADNPSANYILIDNIDCSFVDNWIPIGDSDNPFSGVLDGAGYTISNLSVSIGSYRGLLGYIDTSGIVKNLRISYFSISGNNCGGMIAGYNEGTIQNCEISGTISGNSGNYYEISIGGVAGKNVGTIQYCRVESEVDGRISGNTVGGITGYNAGTISACESTCVISAITTSNGLALSGGVVGLNYGNISLCKSYGTISSSVYYAGCASGGIVGANLGAIEKCYFNGTAYARAVTSNYGGLAGGIAGSNGDQWIGKGGSISNCVYVLSENSSTGDICNISSSYCGTLGNNYNNVIDGAETIQQIESALEGIRLPSTENPDIPDPLPTDGSVFVYFLSGYDNASREVTFGYSEVASLDTYTVADDVDVSNMDQLLNKYVLVTMEQDEDNVLEHTITDIQPVESAIGEVSATGEHSLTIDGTEYPVSEDLVVGIWEGEEVLYHVYNRTIVGVTLLEEKTGTLEAWDSTTGRVTIDGTVYPTNYLSDLSFLANNIDHVLGTSIDYSVPTTGDYIPVLQVNSYETKTGVFSHYDPIENAAYIDGRSYPVDSDVCNTDTNVLNGKEVFFLLKNNTIVHIDKMDTLQSELHVALSPDIHNVTYENQALSANQLSGTLTVNYTSAYDFPQHYDTATVYAACGFPSIKLSSATWEGSEQLDFNVPDLSAVTLNVGENKSVPIGITINDKYVPEYETETLVGICTVTGMPVSGGQAVSKQGTINIVVKTEKTQEEEPEDSAEVQELTTEAGSELSKTKIPFTLDRNIMKNVFGLSGKALERFQQEIFSVIIMSEIPEETLQQKISDKVLNKLFKKWKPDVSATNYTLPLVYEIETNDYGRVTAQFDCEIQVYNLSSSTFGMYINVYCTILSNEKGELNIDYQFLGGGVNYDLQAFADAAWNLVSGELKSAYDMAWGNSANEVADWLFDDTVKKILEANDTTFKDEFWELCTWPVTSIKNECPTDVYIYDESGALRGAIENNLVTMASEDFNLYVEGHTKYIIGLEDDYIIRYVATDNGNMDVTVTEYAGYETPIRQIAYLNVPLIADGYYNQNVPSDVKPQTEEYALISDSQVTVPASEETSLLLLYPAENDLGEETFTITFDANGGTVSASSMTTGTNGKLSSLPTPTRDGYTFTGWYTATNGGDKITTDTVFSTNTTIYAQWTPTGGSSNTGSSDNGSSSGSSSYTVSVPSTIGGQVVVSPTRAEQGDAVTITVTPDAGYELDEILVTDANGNEIEITNKGDGKYTFTMPGSRVEISAIFSKIGTQPELPSLPFTDVSEGAWYYDAVSYVYANGFMNGTSQTSFSPDMPTTRAMVVTILHRMEGTPAASGTTFTDVPAGQWYSDAVTWAYHHKITDGYGNNRFGPDDTITREQLAVMLWRYSGSPEVAGNEMNFIDADETSDWAVEAMQWAVENDIINGKDGNMLDPKGQALRSEIAQVLKNYIENTAE